MGRAALGRDFRVPANTDAMSVRLGGAPDDRFGMPEEAFRAAAESHGPNNPMIRLGMYVPTRQEVATAPDEDLELILDF